MGKARKKLPPLSGGVRKYMGVCGYAEKAVDVVRVQRAIERSDEEILIGYAWEGAQYSLLLERVKDNAYKGQWSASGGGPSKSGDATCRIFPFNEGRLIFGSWREEGVDYYWWAKLDPVTKFPDEAR